MSPTTRKAAVADDLVDVSLEAQPDIEAILAQADEPVVPPAEPEPAPVEPDPEDDEEDVSIAIEDLPDDELLWPDGPTAGMIKAWKKEYGDKRVYVSSVTYDEHIVWRVIRRNEYNNHVRNMEKLINSGQLSQADSGLYNEEAIAQMCILYPPYDRRGSGEELAGVPALISQQVMEASGFQAIEVRQL